MGKQRHGNSVYECIQMALDNNRLVHIFDFIKNIKLLSLFILNHE